MPGDSDESSLKTVGRNKLLVTWFVVGGVFLGVSLVSVPVPGVNEPHYLSKARSFVDPSWCEADFFLQSADAHAVFFAIVGPLAKWLSFHNAILVGRTLSLLLLGWGWSLLGRELHLRPPIIVASACCFCLIAMTGNFSGEWVVGGVESKVPAYGCALACVAFWLRAWSDSRKSHYAISGMLAGLAVSWHPVVGLWFCIGISIAEVLLLASSLSGYRSGARQELRPTAENAAESLDDFRYRQVSGQTARRGDSIQPLASRCAKALINGCVFTLLSFVFALPGLLPVLKVLRSANLPADKVDLANCIQVFWRLAHHLDPSTFPRRAWLHTGVLCCVCAIGLFLLNRHRARNVASESQQATQDIRVRETWLPLVGLLLAAGLIAAIGVAVGWHDGPAMKSANWQLRAMLLKFYPFRFFDALLPIVTSFVLAKLIVNSLPKMLQGATVFLLVPAAICVGFLFRPVAPAGYSSGTYATWKEACQWINDNVRTQSLIYGPRESFGLKLFAERAEYVCFKDCPQDAAGIMEWNRRLSAIHRWSQNAYQDSVYDEADLESLRQETGITHILTKRLGPFVMEPVWRNAHWRIYKTTNTDGNQRAEAVPRDPEAEK